MPSHLPNGEVLELWATPVSVSTIPRAASDDVMLNQEAATSELLRHLTRPPEAKSQVSRGPVTLRAGQGISLGANSPGWIAVAYLRVVGSSGNHGGALFLYDPRPGNLMIEMPGSPWGRPMVIAPSPGTVITFPGWMAWSILPAEEDQQIDILVMTCPAR